MAAKRRSTRPGRALEQSRMTFLRYPTKRDEQEFTELRRSSDAFLRKWNPMPPRSADTYSRASFQRFLGDSRSLVNDRTLVCRASDGVILGNFNISQIFRAAFQSAYLGYWVGVEHARRGYMSDALPLLLRHAFRRLKLHRLEANIIPENTASIALVRGAGFQKEGYSPRYLKVRGRWRDHERWAILADEVKGRTRG